MCSYLSDLYSVIEMTLLVTVGEGATDSVKHGLVNSKGREYN